MKRTMRSRRGHLKLEALERRLLLNGEPFDWADGDWGIIVSDRGTPDSTSVTVSWPGGSAQGNALEVYHTITDGQVPQLWAFLTDGFWRQAGTGQPFGTSYRLFSFYDGSDALHDRAEASDFTVTGVTEGGALQLALGYDSGAAGADSFAIEADVLLDPPAESSTCMTVELTITNTGDSAVTPAWQGHRDLAEQWELFGVSSMYVADNLTGGLPAWYDTLDPTHAYVGIVDDASYLNDGYSVNGRIGVSTHDAKRIVAGGTAVVLDHDRAVCPPVNVAAYSWYEQLVLLDHPAETLRVEHLYEPGRDHAIERLSAVGLTDDLSQLKWSATCNRDDPNMVDGDNAQVKLGLDDFQDVWPAGASETVTLRLTAGTDFADRLLDELDYQARQFNDSFYVYRNRDSGANHYVPSWVTNGDGTLTVETDALRAAGDTTVRVAWDGGAGSDGYPWNGVGFEEPSGYFSAGASGDGYALFGGSPAPEGARLMFDAKLDAEDAGDSVEFGFGGAGDSTANAGWWVALDTDWTTYSLDLSGLDLSSLHLGFLATVNDTHDVGADGVTFYLDNIRFEWPRADAPRLVQSYDVRPDLGTDFDVTHANTAYTYDQAVTLMALNAGRHLERRRAALRRVHERRSARQPDRELAPHRLVGRRCGRLVHPRLRARRGQQRLGDHGLPGPLRRDGRRRLVDERPRYRGLDRRCALRFGRRVPDRLEAGRRWRLGESGRQERGTEC